MNRGRGEVSRASSRREDEALLLGLESRWLNNGTEPPRTKPFKGKLGSPSELMNIHVAI